MEILAVCKGRCTLLRKLSARSPRIWTLDDDLGDGDDVEVMVMMMVMLVKMVKMVMMVMVIITIGCQCMETKEMQALENDYASAEADEGLVVQPTRCKRNSDGDGEDHQEDEDELFLEEG